METEDLRNTLALHLDTLKRNLEAVPLEILKTQYKKPYDALRQNISSTASAYVRQAALGGIRIRSDLVWEAKELIESAICRSGLTGQISAAAFRHQDIGEIDELAFALREVAQEALVPLYNRHLVLYLDTDADSNGSGAPVTLNEATGCVWRDGRWQQIK